VEIDESFRRAVDCVLEQGRATISLLQERLGVRYFEAAKLLDQLEQQGIIGQYSGSLARPVLISRQDWDERTRSSA
jgi:S-DNA-T family DNA segregation ATPase FtsK/SpoIIIE